MKPSKLIEALTVFIKNNLPVLIKGKPGIGKSDIVAQATIDAQARLIISHPVVSSPVDYKGFPYVVDGKAIFLPFGDLCEIIDATEPTVYFIDDLGQAPPAVQAACMQLLLARRINEHEVSKFVTFMAATNRKTDNAGVTGVLDPVKSRFVTILNLDIDHNDWSQWALVNNIPVELIAFNRFRPNFLNDDDCTVEVNRKRKADIENGPCPRTLHNIAKIMGCDMPKEIEFELFAGAAGEAFASEFTGFLKIFRHLPNPDAIILSPDSVDVPNDPATLYALSGALSKRASEASFDNILKYIKKMPKEFEVFTVLDSIKINKKLHNTTGFIGWASDNSEVMI